MKKISLYLIIAMTALGLSSCHHTEPDGIIVDAVTDADGHTYNAVRLGNQIWMASNLYAFRYSNGTEIFNAALGHGIGSDVFRVRPNNDEALVSTFGLLYSWPAATDGKACVDDGHPVQGVCPNGWHIPSVNEWKELADYVNRNPEYLQKSSTAVKALSADHAWTASASAPSGSPSCQVEINNSTQMNILPAGYYSDNHYNEFEKCACFWTSTQRKWHDNGYWYVSIHYGEDTLSYEVVHQTSFPQGVALSVRCVKD